MKEYTSHINFATIRRDDQRKVMEEIAKAGHCPFCRENLHLYHMRPIITEGKFWLITENQWPYEHTKQQLLAIYKTHIEHLNDMDPKAGEELIRLFQDEAKKRKIIGGGVAIRFGKDHEHGNYGSSVFHIHAHLFEPDLVALKSNEAWRFKFGQPRNYKSGGDGKIGK